MKPRSIPLLVSGMMALAASAASAHAFLDHANPAVGSSLAKPPGVIRIWFTQGIEPAFSTIEVTDGSGRRVDADDARVDAKDRAQLYETLKPLPPGTYKVHWRVVSIDTHPTEGTFSFDIGP